MKRKTPLGHALLYLMCGLLYSTTAFAAEKTLHERIDQQIESGFRKWDAKAASRSSDAEFLRRVFLDLTGSIPDSQTVRKFLAEDHPDKRGQLVDQLLASDDFARHMAIVFDVMLMERRPDKYVTTREWRSYLEQSFAMNKPLDVLSAEILAGEGTDEKLRPAAKFYLDRAVEKDTLVRDIGRLFLGVDMQCAQCHDHPSIEDYLHEHYYGLSVFVAGSKTFKQPDGKMVLQETVVREVEFASVFDPDTTRTTGPRLLDLLLDLPATTPGEEYVEKPSRTVRAVPKFSLRKLLAKKLPSQETPEFARNMANRFWAMMMGRGIVHPLDMHHSANPPSHPELLELLASQLALSKYNTKAFLRELALSKTYQRSSLIPEGIDPKQVPEESFAVANMKGLSPDQLFASLLKATDSEQLLESQIEEALKEDQAAYQKLLDDQEKLIEARLEKTAERIQQFVALFGSTPGRPEGEFQSSLPHALFFANSETVISWIEPKGENITAQLLKIEDHSQLVETAYVSLLSRMPTTEEIRLGAKHLEDGKSDRQAAVMELGWSLLASAEFRLNH